MGSSMAPIVYTSQVTLEDIPLWKRWLQPVALPLILDVLQNTHWRTNQKDEHTANQPDNEVRSSNIALIVELMVE